jgi:hypothetical protein
VSTYTVGVFGNGVGSAAAGQRNFRVSLHQILFDRRHFGIGLRRVLRGAGPNPGQCRGERDGEHEGELQVTHHYRWTIC